MGLAFAFFALAAVVGIAAFVAVQRKRRGQGRQRAANLHKGTAGQETLATVPDPKRVHAHLEIDYKDGNGTWTRRFVQVKEFDNETDGGILIGHCELRGATRTFRFDRIKQCVDLGTGDIVENVQKYLNDVYEASSVISDPNSLRPESGGNEMHH